jgi:hypothetical protein
VVGAGKRLRPWVMELKRIWFAMQISQRGKYSVERMIALEEYTRTASVLRVSMVCICTPLPMIALVLLVEMIPLQLPSDGWHANYGIWIRTAIQAGAVALTAAGQATYLLERVSFSVWQLAGLFASIAVSYTGVAITVAANIAFPIPFMAVTMSLAFFTLLSASFRAVLGDRAFREILGQRRQLVRFLGFVSAQMTLILVYPLYQALFQLAAIDAYFEFATLLLLPVIKSVMKHLVSLTMAHMEDMVPEAVMFTVDFFNAVYLATCMQNATSVVTIATIMTVDFLQTAIALHDLNRRTDITLTCLQKILGSSRTGDSMLDAALSLCQRPEKFIQQKRTYIRINSCLPYRLSPTSQSLLDGLRTIQDTRPAHPSAVLTSTTAIEFPPIPRTLPKIKAMYTSRTAVSPSHAVLPLTPDTMSEPSSDVLSETLRLLFTTECLVLAEYLEAVMPALYATFMAVMVHLPNANYHSELQGIDPQNMGSRLQIIFLYASLELASLLGLVLLLRRRGLLVMHQLAFVLETQRALVQGKLLLWMLMAMGFRVVHFGADFNFLRR